MNKSQFEQLSKDELINLILNKQTPAPATRTKRKDWTKKPIPKPRRSVKQMFKDHEDNIIAPPVEFQDDIILPPPPFRDKPVPAPENQETRLVQSTDSNSKSQFY